MIYRDIRKAMEKIPKRRWSTVAKPILDGMNAAFLAVMGIEEDPIRGTKRAAATRYRCICKAIDRIAAMEMLLWIWWDTSMEESEPGIKEQIWKKRANWCDRFNSVTDILYKMKTESSLYRPESDHGIPKMNYFTEKEINDAIFLTRLREFRRMTHAKHIRLSRIARDAESAMVVKLADMAFYYAVSGNRYRTFVQKEKDERARRFRIAMAALKRAERALFDLFTNDELSNREMTEWAELLNECERLLAGVVRAA